jgi:hypothetical protein
MARMNRSTLVLNRRTAEVVRMEQRSIQACYQVAGNKAALTVKMFSLFFV